MYKKGAEKDKQGKDAGNRTLCPYRNFSQAIKQVYYNVKDIHRRQKLMTDFFRLLELTILAVNISISRKKFAYRGFQGVIF